MKVCVLGSGSKGNCTYIESGSTRILIDAGFSGKEIERRLAAIGRSAEGLTAILVTHEHHDHIAGVGVLSRRYGLPVFINNGTYQAAQRKLGKLTTLRSFTTGELVIVNELQVHPFSIVHDAADPVGFVIRKDMLCIGYCTDTGQITRLINHHLRSCSTLILEANHDPQMLRDGPYPMSLKQRIQSKNGHLANGEAVQFASCLAQGVLQNLVLAHISETNNHPDLVLSAAEKAFVGCKNLEVHLARQDLPGPLISVKKQSPDNILPLSPGVKTLVD